MDNSIYEDKRSRGMATAAIILGIVGLATGCCVYTGIICGALAILFALLSKGGEMTMDRLGKTGLILGIISIVFGIGMLITVFAMVFRQFGGFDGYMNYMNEIMQQIDPAFVPYEL